MTSNEPLLDTVQGSVHEEQRNVLSKQVSLVDFPERSCVFSIRQNGCIEVEYVRAE
jgi:hypothetical protein